MDGQIIGPKRNLLLGALDEMKFWVRIVFEHLKFHRHGVDPGNERAVRTIDEYAIRVEQFYNANIFPVPETTPDPSLAQLTERTLGVIVPVRDFKAYLTQEITACRLLTLIDPSLSDHLRRETDYLIGQLRYTRGEPTPTRETLGIPDGTKRALTVPRRVLTTLQGIEFFIGTIENIMFFSRIHGEHAQDITLVTRPEIQEDIRLRAQQFEQLFFANIQRAQTVENTGTGFNELVSESYTLAIQFRDFMVFVNDALQRCAVPTGRVNAWPLLADHITREAQYFVDILSRVSTGVPEPPPITPYYPYIV